MRFQNEADNCGFLVPQTIVIRSDYSEAVPAGRKIVEVSHAPCAGVNPIAIITFKLILEPYPLRNQQTLRREMKLDLVLVGRDLNIAIGRKLGRSTPSSNTE